MSRPDTYILKLNQLKKNLGMQIIHCSKSLMELKEIKSDENYEEASTDLEKSNIETLTGLISEGLEVLEEIVW